MDKKLKACHEFMKDIPFFFKERHFISKKLPLHFVVTEKFGNLIDSYVDNFIEKLTKSVPLKEHGCYIVAEIRGDLSYVTVFLTILNK